MSATASAVNEISANIEGVKQKALTQASSATETVQRLNKLSALYGSSTTERKC